MSDYDVKNQNKTSDTPDEQSDEPSKLKKTIRREEKSVKNYQFFALRLILILAVIWVLFFVIVGVAHMPSADMYPRIDMDGLMSWNGAASGKAMMASSATANTLDAKALTVMTHKSNNEDKLFVPNDSDITMWRFTWVEDDFYTLSATVDGSAKYLQISPDGLTLSDTPAQLQLLPGTGIHAGQISLTANGKTLTYSGQASTGFNVGGSVGSEWLYLVDLSELTQDYLS